MTNLFSGAACALLTLAAGAAAAMDVTTLTSNDPLNAWRTVTYPNGTVATYTAGIGSAAFRHPADPANIIYTLSDRGPNFTCDAAAKIMGAESQPMCKDVKGARFYPTPDYSPSIYRLVLDRASGTFAIKDVIALKNAMGEPISGLLNPQRAARTDTALDIAGAPLPFDPDAIDAEGLVKLSDGSFWIGEEMGPSILHVAADGRILTRYVPADAAADYADADMKIVAALPAVLSRRQANRGIESMAVSPDEAFLYFMVQNPLANPNADAYKAARNTRLFKFDRAAGRLVGEYVYQLDTPDTFGFDTTKAQSAPRISEVTALGADRLLVLERTDKTTKLHEVSLAGATNFLGSAWDDAATAPSLEQRNDLSGTAITPVAKVLRFDTFRDAKGAPVKIEGVALLGDGSLALVNDNDFGITGETTAVLVVKGAVTADKAAYAR